MANILLAEDHAVLREPIKALLEQHGYSVQAVCDGAAAMAALSAHPPDLVMLDLGMPGIDGHDVLARMRRCDTLKAIPVVVLTARTDRHTVIEMAKLGVNAYLSKGECCLEGMLTAVRTLLESPLTDHQTPPLAGPPAHHEPQAVDRHSPMPGIRVCANAPPVSNTEQAPPSDVREALRSIQPIMRHSDAADRIKAAAQLKGFSPVVAEVLRITDSPRCTIEAVATAVGHDPAMALRVIRLANSCAYSHASTVDSVKKAVVQIGLKKIRETVLALAVVDRFASAALQTRLCIPRFWEHCFACAIIASEIARATEPEHADRAFLCGLLHDLGRLVLAEELGDIYAEVIDTAHRLQLPLEQVESRMLSITHADVVAMVADAWHLPVMLTGPLSMHHATPRSLRALDAAQNGDVLRLVAADRFAHALLIGDSGNDTVSPTMELCSTLGLGSAAMERIETETRRKITELARMMPPVSPPPSSPTPKELFRKTLSGPFRPLFLGDNPEIDSHRLLCSTLADPAALGPPTLAVCSVTSVVTPEFLSALGEHLLVADRRVNGDPLPLLALSSVDGIEIPSSALGGRPIEILSTPFTVPRFIGAVNRLSKGIKPAAAQPMSG